VDGARVVAHSSQLFGLGVVCAAAITDRIRRPDTHMSICKVSILACLRLFECRSDKAHLLLLLPTGFRLARRDSCILQSPSCRLSVRLVS
jgi:hypothetical protein